MNTLGIIGGMSWESSALYYRHINREVARVLGGLHSAPLLLASLDFEAVARRQRAGEWEALAAMLADTGRRLQQAGAKALLIATNTMHKVAPEVANAVDVPLIHIGDVTADALCASGARTVGLLGTRFTMEQRFYVDRLAARGIECLVPDAPGREAVHRIIFEELCQGRIEADSRRALQRECTALAQAGAEAIVLGCTELTLLLGPGDLPLPVFDTTELHALAGAAFVLEGVHAATMAA